MKKEITLTENYGIQFINQIGNRFGIYMLSSISNDKIDYKYKLVFQGNVSEVKDYIYLLSSKTPIIHNQ